MRQTLLVAFSFAILHSSAYGMYYDKETGTNYNVKRDYVPSSGRYVQSDPLGLRAGNNTYVYVTNDPMTRIDPTGEFGWDTVVIWGARLVSTFNDAVELANWNPNAPATTAADPGSLGGGGTFGGAGATGQWGCPECERRKSALFQQCVEDHHFDPVESRACAIKFRDYCDGACSVAACKPAGTGAVSGASGGWSGRGATGSW